MQLARPTSGGGSLRRRWSSQGTPLGTAKCCRKRLAAVSPVRIASPSSGVGTLAWCADPQWPWAAEDLCGLCGWSWWVGVRVSGGGGRGRVQGRLSGGRHATSLVPRGPTACGRRSVRGLFYAALPSPRPPAESLTLPVCTHRAWSQFHAPRGRPPRRGLAMAACASRRRRGGSRRHLDRRRRVAAAYATTQCTIPAPALPPVPVHPAHTSPAALRSPQCRESKTQDAVGSATVRARQVILHGAPLARGCGRPWRASLPICFSTHS